MGRCARVQAWALANGNAHWQTMVFTVLTLGQMAHVMRRGPLVAPGPAQQPAAAAGRAAHLRAADGDDLPAVLNRVFKTEPLSALELAICLAASAVVWRGEEGVARLTGRFCRCA